MTNEQHAQTLEKFAGMAECNPRHGLGAPHYCPNCDNSIEFPVEALRAAIAALRAPQGLTRLTDQDLADLDTIREFIGPDKPLRDILTWLRSLPPVSPATEPQEDKDDGAGLIHQPIPDMAGTEPRPHRDAVNVAVNALWAAITLYASHWQAPGFTKEDEVEQAIYALISAAQIGSDGHVSNSIDGVDYRIEVINGEAFMEPGHDRIVRSTTFSNFIFYFSQRSCYRVPVGSAPISLSEASGSAGRSAAPTTNASNGPGRSSGRK